MSAVVPRVGRSDSTAAPRYTVLRTFARAACFGPAAIRPRLAADLADEDTQWPNHDATASDRQPARVQRSCAAIPLLPKYSSRL